MTGRFLPLTDATYWSDTSRVPHTDAPMVAFNHARAHILAAVQEAEPPAPPRLRGPDGPPGAAAARRQRPGRARRGR